MRSAAPKLLALALSTLLCIGFAELAVRVVKPQSLSIWAHTRDGLVVHQRNVRGHVTPAGKRVDTNAHGMRDVAHAVAKPPGTFRILLLGDSFMEANQVEWEDSLAARLAGLLDARGATDVEVINAGVSGWGTDDQRTYYLRYGRPWQADLVVVAMTLHNDLFDNLAMQFTTLQDGRLVDRPPELVATLPWIRMQVQQWLASHSHLYRLATGTLHAEAVREGGQQLRRDLSELIRATPSPKVERGWRVTHALLDRLVGEVRADGAELAVFMVPLLVQVEPAVLRGYMDEMSIEPSMLDLDGPQRRMLEWGRRRGVTVIDLLPDFEAAASAGPLYLESDGHWNERGHALGASVVARELLDAGLVTDEAARPIARGERS